MFRHVSLLLKAVMALSLLALPSTVFSAPVTITFMHFKSDVTDGVQAVIDKFEAANPDIKVEVQPVKYDSYYNLLKIKAASGDVVDVFTLNAGTFTKGFVDGGYLEDLTGKSFLKNFAPDVVKSQATNGRNYIMPLNGGPISILYNKKIFQDLKLEVPRTNDALWVVADKIKKAGKTPFALGWKDTWPFAMWATRDLPSTVVLDGNQTTWPAGIETGISKFSGNRYAKQTLERAAKFYQYGNKDQYGVDYNGVVDLFSRGDVAMMYMGTWPLDTIKEKNPDLWANMGAFPYPFSNNATLNKLEFGPDASLAIHAKSKNKEAALKFLAFMASVDAGNTWVDATKTLSLVTGTKTDIAPAVADLKPYLDAGMVYNSQFYLEAVSIDWGAQFTQHAAKYIFKQQTADQALAAMDAWVAKNHK